jgi:hypothetical protein
MEALASAVKPYRTDTLGISNCGLPVISKAISLLCGLVRPHLGDPRAGLFTHYACYSHREHTQADKWRLLLR